MAHLHQPWHNGCTFPKERQQPQTCEKKNQRQQQLSNYLDKKDAKFITQEKLSMKIFLGFPGFLFVLECYSYSVKSSQVNEASVVFTSIRREQFFK